MTCPNVLAIVLNWRQAQTTIECVHTLGKMHYPKLDVLVVDNGSKDGSANTLKRELPKVKLIQNPENMGFAAGVNVGLRYAIDNNYPFALIINNDAFPHPDMLKNLINAATSLKAALTSPKILFEEQPNKIWFAGGKQHPKLLEITERGQNEIDGPKWQGNREVDYLLGTCLLVNIASMKDVGFLDERYFMYYEDLDWSIRFREQGFKLYVISDACLYHRVAVSSGGTNAPSRRYHLARSSILFFTSHANQGSKFLILLYRFISILKQFGLLLLDRNFNSARALLSGIKDGLIAAKRRK